MPGGQRSLGILSIEEAKELKQQGWRAADLHVHTFCSPDVLPAGPLHPEALYLKAKAAGLDFVTFTDHDTMQAYELVGRRREGLVTGVEIKVHDPEMVGHTIHVNVYDLYLDQFSELKEIAEAEDLNGFLACLKRNDLPHVYNHPLWFEPGERPNLAAVPKLARLFPVLEYNMHRIDRKNQLVMEMARKFNRGLVAATDTHSGMVGKIYTIAKGETFREFFRNIKKGNSYIVVRDLTREDLVEEINAWIGLVFSLETAAGAPGCSTGISYLDKVIHALTSETLRDFPRLYSYAMRLAYGLSNSGLPASLYLRWERSLLPEIEKQLSMILRENVLYD
jgi:predicted metal-dependent phosphoesterase TrpH